jgi:hypothetical protein
MVWAADRSVADATVVGGKGVLAASRMPDANEAYKALFCLAISSFCLEISDASFSKDSVCERIKLVFERIALVKDSVCERIKLVFERIALVFERIAEIHSASL